MKIGMWSDSVNFPNLPLMKLSAYHKEQNDSVEMIQEGGHYDRVYLSKIFNLPLISKIPKSPPIFQADDVVRGGTGYAIQVENGKEVFHSELHENLPKEIEHLYPDYSLYPEFRNTAYGFLTRGCCNACSFCIVCPKEGNQSIQVADLDEFWRGQKEIKLLDPNLLACRQKEVLLRELIDSKARVDFTQGLDARFIDDDIASLINQIKIKTIHFAFDFMRNEKAIIRGLQCFKRHYNGSDRNIKCYVLTNYDTTHEEDWYRVRSLVELGYQPYVMIYQKGTHDQFLTDLARWSNSLFLNRSVSFEDYVPRKDGKSCKELYPEILKEKEIFVMPTKKTEETAVDYTSMNAMQKLQIARVEFLNAGVKKTGKNISLEFKYFELEDIVPVAEAIFGKVGLLMVPTFGKEYASAKVYNCDDRGEEPIVFEAPFTQIAPIISNSGKAVTNEMQALGSSITYMRRYLWQLVLDIIEADDIDASLGKDTEGAPPAPKTTKKAPVTTEQRTEIKKELTSPPAEAADESSVGDLKAVLKKLLELDSEQESFVQSIAMKTEGFSKITKDQCDQLISGVKEMLAAYDTQEG